MSELLKKELRLTASPLTYWFLAFTAMAWIPGYPILVGAFFVCLGLFYTYQFAREQNDIVYTALLPVAKGDIARAKFRFVWLVQGMAFALFAVFTLVRMAFCADAAVFLQNPMMNANLVFLGWVLVLFALFEVVFLVGFFRTAYAFGKPFLIFAALSLVLIGAAETLHHFPNLEWMNTTGFDHLGAQLVFLAVCIVFWLAASAISLRAAARSMERIDL